MNFKRSFHLNVILFVIILTACQREEFISDSNATLYFSTDTVQFDTIFTTLGSTTKQLLVFNNYDKKIKIKKIELAGNTANFRLNINGFSKNKLTDIEIQANDSMYIFVEITIDPLNKNTPLIVHDSIIFETNGNIQDIDLVAYGQDVQIFNEYTIDSSLTFTNEKPYLIFNSMLVDSLQTLTIEAGSRLHFAKHSRLYVLGSLVVNGTLDEPVVFEGGRLEYMYTDVPGQWEGIWLLRGSAYNKINYAIIKNAIIGLQVDSMMSETEPTLTITNTRIEHVTAIGLYAQGSSVLAANCLFADCGMSSVYLNIGGSYEFYHCTMANHWQLGSRDLPAVLLNNYYKDKNDNYHIRNLNNAYFANCIIHGNRSDGELYLDAYPNEGVFNFKFHNCYIRLNEKQIFTGDTSQFYQCIIRPNLSFKNPYEPDYNYQLDTLSLAKDRADPQIVEENLELLEFDIEGVSRRTTDTLPDPGAFERVE